MTERTYSLEILEKPIGIRIIDTGRGINVLITGGDSAHIGAVSIALPGQSAETIEFPEHRDSAVSKRWASQLSERTGSPVIVCCGIHYDGITRDQINTVVSELDSFLERLDI